MSMRNSIFSLLLKQPRSHLQAQQYRQQEIHLTFLITPVHLLPNYLMVSITLHGYLIGFSFSFSGIIALSIALPVTVVMIAAVVMVLPILVIYIRRRKGKS